MNKSTSLTAPPHGANADWSVPQNWEQFSASDHQRWSDFAAKQTKALEGLACDTFLDGVRALELDRMGVPQFDVWNEKLRALTGWEVVAVPGVIPNAPFFEMLAKRQFPVANFLRQGPSFDYSDEPDMFHDVFGHMPMFIDPTFGEFMSAYGRAGIRAEKLGMSDYLGRLYLHTVEFGLIKEGGQLRAYGAGLMSSYAEAVHALTSDVPRRLRFDLPRLMRTDWPFDTFQPTYFVIESFEALLEEMETTSLAHVYDEVRDLPLIPIGEAEPSDVTYEAASPSGEAG
ncbi:phenylalanine 4-monooxygenase [Erythrobacter sp. SCSIO 43205]|uniref:phenylalanine 4-monooxygenase n=1 Tax=Erythrobacter sp. SCSIO 43205 TaxID=2779361 RepID=UPI001CA902CB|nr:phenylalanine 4-monooxygenase [Erythrobacter sp. SCSIO 43205]UAB78842.1 phenylalanine 4-monooxygenase [Erythrobacter sp. SCSIO 43205]